MSPPGLIAAVTIAVGVKVKAVAVPDVSLGSVSAPVAYGLMPRFTCPAADDGSTSLTSARDSESGTNCARPLPALVFVITFVITLESRPEFIDKSPLTEFAGET